MKRLLVWKCITAAVCCGLQSEDIVVHIVSSSPANCFTETLRGFSTARGLVGFEQTLLPFLWFSSHTGSLLTPANQFRGAIV